MALPSEASTSGMPEMVGAKVYAELTNPQNFQFWDRSRNRGCSIPTLAFILQDAFTHSLITQVLLRDINFSMSSDGLQSYFVDQRRYDRAKFERYLRVYLEVLTTLNRGRNRGSSKPNVEAPAPLSSSFYNTVFEEYHRQSRINPSNERPRQGRFGQRLHERQPPEPDYPVLITCLRQAAGTVLSLFGEPGLSVQDLTAYLPGENVSNVTGKQSQLEVRMLQELWQSTCTSYHHISAASRSTTPQSSTGLYSPLAPFREFRLVTLHAGMGEDPIVCTLQRASLVRHPEFVALSYEWGDSHGPTHSIELNGGSLMVGLNLWYALSHLRRKNKDIIIWVDALCINQSSTQEKGDQVSLMGYIYSSAHRVVSWTGLNEEHTSQRALVWMLELVTGNIQDQQSLNRPGGSQRRLYESLEARFKRCMKSSQGQTPGSEDGARGPQAQAQPQGQGSSRSTTPQPSGQKRLAISLHKSIHRSDLIDASHFFSITYWTRLWIIQEVVLARRLRIQCGPFYIDWSKIREFLQILHMVSSSADALPPYIVNLILTPGLTLLNFKLDSRVQVGQNRGEFGPNLGLTRALQRFSTSKSADARDKVYGLFGVTDSSHGLVPNYNQSPLDLWAHLLSTRGLRSNDQLISFTTSITEALELGEAKHGERRLQPSSPLYYTRGTIHGVIEVAGAEFTDAASARALLTQWYELYFHRIKDHGPDDGLPKPVHDILPFLEADVARVAAIHSCMSYGYIGRENIRRRPSVSTTMRQLRGLGAAQSSCNPAAEVQIPCSCLATRQISYPARFVIGSRGQVGLVPASAREGDHLVHFAGTDICAIMRGSGRKGDDDDEIFTIVGAGIVFRQWDEDAVRPHPFAAQPLRYSTGSPRRDSKAFSEDVDQMSVHIDADCLRILTSPAWRSGGLKPDEFLAQAPREKHLESFLQYIYQKSGTLDDDPDNMDSEY
ncbi:heterokaryon incompatibility protein-domain-containing protein [Xylariales sp. PMI_506]|nr:heterokaryon incompatibility protein-domain-containing protein [Xylariales sp. PMI_506]